MSLTGFNRRRRMIAEMRAKAETKVKAVEAKNETMDLNKCTKDKLKVLLDERGIEYDEKATKLELIELLSDEGAE